MKAHIKKFIEEQMNDTRKSAEKLRKYIQNGENNEYAEYEFSRDFYTFLGLRSALRIADAINYDEYNKLCDFMEEINNYAYNID